MTAYYEFKSGNGVTKVNVYLTEEDIETYSKADKPTAEKRAKEFFDTIIEAVTSGMKKEKQRKVE